jgi:transcriptional regulator with XRE-family HTH domain
MKQPELGKKISELRKAKGLTQEELVEKCNISVRTIQRIEAGEVTPRVYTIKTILGALDYDITTIKDDEQGFFHSWIDWINKFLLLDTDFARVDDHHIAQVNIAWISGLIYFVLGFLEAAAEYFRYDQHRIIYGGSVYTILKILILLSFILFQRGFIVLGGIFQNYLLKIVSYILIFGNFLIIGYDIASIFYNSIEREFILGAEALTFGGIGIIYGISLFRLRNILGEAAKYAGVFEVIAGGFFLTIVLSFMGFIILIPAELLEIIILYKGSEMIKNNEKVTHHPQG